MKNNLKVHPMLRAFSVFGLVAVLVGGVTYAALQGQATLTNSTIASANAQLQVKSTGSFAAQDSGFAFTGIIPGAAPAPVPAKTFQLKNNGSINLQIAASIPTAPTFTVLPTGTVDPTKVDLVLACTNGVQTFSLTTDVTALVTAHGDGGVPMLPDALPFGASGIANCTAQVQMDADAFTGESASSTNFNIVFTATPFVVPS